MNRAEIENIVDDVVAETEPAQPAAAAPAQREPVDDGAALAVLARAAVHRHGLPADAVDFLGDATDADDLEARAARLAAVIGSRGGALPGRPTPALTPTEAPASGFDAAEVAAAARRR